ncbi:hypothetical protein D018_2705 [Vibrio parahaemolyticus VP2007-007]|nr:hypothetical protein D018_2705 [Vibrio parahaemolyticus VP2007-007]
MQNISHLTIIDCRRRRLSPTVDGDTKTKNPAPMTKAIDAGCVD